MSISRTPQMTPQDDTRDFAFPHTSSVFSIQQTIIFTKPAHQVLLVQDKNNCFHAVRVRVWAFLHYHSSAMRPDLAYKKNQEP